MMADVDVREVVDDMVDKLVAGYQPDKIILFGSYAYGHPHADSDIDLLIIKNTPERFLDRWVKVRLLLSDSRHGMPLETLVLTPKEIDSRLAVGDQFIAEIIAKGVVVYDEQRVSVSG